LFFFFFENIRRSNYSFCGHNILTEDVFAAHLPGNGGISVLRIVWVTTNCCFDSDVTQETGGCCFIRSFE